MGKIYKYRDIESDKTLKIIENCELFFSEPKNFNDPFDSFIEFDFNGTAQDWERYFREMGLPPETVKTYIHNIMAGITKPSEFSLSTETQHSSVLKICCFSEEPDNMLLWSHYGKDHTGVCIGFQTYTEFNSNCMHFDPKDLNAIGPIPKGTVPLIEVNYDINMPAPYNRILHDTKRLLEFTKTKSQDWLYEKEHRVILYDKIVINNPVHFSPNELTDIIFGINTQEKDKDMVMNSVKKYPSAGKWVDFYQCRRSKGKYKIELVKI